MSKNDLIDALLSTLVQDLELMRQAAQAAHAAATHSESRAEDSHDTRGLEASYLAGAQAKRARELERQIALVRTIPREVITRSNTAPRVQIGSAAELKSEGRLSTYFVVASGGGMTLDHESVRIHFITPQSPLGQELVGRCPGEQFTVENPQGEREYEVVRVY